MNPVSEIWFRKFSASSTVSAFILNCMRHLFERKKEIRTVKRHSKNWTKLNASKMKENIPKKKTSSDFLNKNS